MITPPIDRILVAFASALFVAAAVYFDIGWAKCAMTAAIDSNGLTCESK
jgi:hypothetical protein